ncbi:MAG: transglycosylase SLT domain-containing protein [Betaproteobacteria bacterium]|nr:transglycosylase SLT domain-containing protein [Betaproteobacteria bacterium]
MRIRLPQCLLISLTTALVNFSAAAAGFSGADEVSGTAEFPDTTKFFSQQAIKITPEESAASADISVPGIDVPDVPAPVQEINDSIPGIANPRPDIWERIRSGFAMTELDGEESRHGEAFYASRPHYMKRIVERSKRYLFHIMEEVERRGMPAEIALIPIIESAFNPAANSHSHASGIWQLIPSTGKNYGLKQNWWYDERRDIIAATDAALNHLKKLYGMFGDWKLALASYNWGEGAIGRALVRNRNNGLPADFNNITLPPETRNFLQRLIAVKNIISNPAAFGIELVSIPDQPYFEKISATRHIDVQLAAKLANIPLDEFKALNPAHNRPVINADTVPTLLLPADKVEVFTENLKNHNEPLVSWQAYRAKKGETIEGIAAQYGIGPQRLKDINDIGGPGGITPGQTLLVPVNGSAGGEDISTMSDKPAAPKLPERFFIYAVKKGDVLFNIAKRHGITVAQIKSWNRDTNRLSIGQKLILKQT